MKLKRKEIKSCRVAYLYHDGHMVLVHEKSDRDAGKVEWVTIYENVGIKTYFDNPGRLIIDPAVLPFLPLLWVNSYVLEALSDKLSFTNYTLNNLPHARYLIY